MPEGSLGYWVRFQSATRFKIFLPLNRLLMTEAPVPSLYGFEGIFSAMLQISRFVVSHELDDT